MLTTKNPVPDNQEGMTRIYDQLINDCLFRRAPCVNRIVWFPHFDGRAELNDQPFSNVLIADEFVTLPSPR